MQESVGFIHIETINLAVYAIYNEVEQAFIPACNFTKGQIDFIHTLISTLTCYYHARIILLAERQKYNELEEKYAELLSYIKTVQEESASVREMRKVAEKVDDNEYRLQLWFKPLHPLLPKEG